jgi:hypothetical protein
MASLHCERALSSFQLLVTGSTAAAARHIVIGSGRRRRRLELAKLGVESVVVVVLFMAIHCCGARR